MISIFLIILPLIVKTFAQVSYTSCPYLQPVIDFELANFTGTWYEVVRYPNIYEIYYECSRAEYIALNENDVMVDYHAINSISGAEIHLKVNASRIIYRYHQSIGWFTIQLSNYVPQQVSIVTVLDTDYNNYAIISMGQPLENKCLIYVWMLSRSQTPAATHLEKFRKILLYNFLPAEPLIEVGHDYCPFIDNQT